jgi:hypothetical protein
MEETIKELFCKACNYKTDRNYDWLKHIKSQKHQRNGEKKSTKCDLCEFESTSHWNVKAHKLQIHATPEERSQQKYYCGLCDYVFFCKQYLDKHTAGKHHQTKLKIKQSLEEINEKNNTLNNK